MTHSPYYLAYIRGPRWAEKRRDYYSRHPYRCARCGSTEGLNLHHRDYRTLGHEPDSALVPLCRKHHRRVHRIRKVTKLPLRLCTWLVLKL